MNEAQAPQNEAQALLARLPLSDPLSQYIPAELTALPQWVAYAAQERGGKVTKPPLDPKQNSPRFASVDKPETWGSFGEAMAFLCAHRGEAFTPNGTLAVVAGVGFMLTAETGADIDHCIDPATGAVLPWAKPLVDAMQAAGFYLEASPSGTGLRGFCREPLPPECGNGFKRNGVEVYRERRFLTVTGRRLEGSGSTLPSGPVCAQALFLLWKHAHPDTIQPALPRLPAQTGPSPEERFKAMFGGDGGARRKALFDGPADEASPSEQDLALANAVAHFFGPDPSLCEWAMQQSGRRRDKWEQKHYADGSTYLEGTICKALEGHLGQFYEDFWREKERQYNKGKIVPTERGETPLQDVKKPITQDDLAMDFIDKYGDDIRYCHTVGKWYQWNGIYWQPQETNLAFHWCRTLCREAAKEAKRKKEYAELKRVSTASAVEKFAQSDPRVAITHDKFDLDTWLLGTPEGTVDLKSGLLKQAQRQNMITKLASVAPKAGPCPQWLKFLDEATKGDAEMVRYIQQLAGYMLTGDTREQILIFIYGPGCNGKSVFLNVLRDILNDYAKTASMDTFMASKNDRHPTDLAMLAGARIVTASETEDGRTWAEGRIKELTGQDPITARFMRQDFFTYVPQFKLLLIGNHAPQLRNVGESITRRFRVIPFLFKPEIPDKELPNKLKNEYPQILHWMINGCIDWQKNGLITPQKVSEYTQSYLDSQDIIKQWIEECCELSTCYITKTKDLVASWDSYASQFNVPKRSVRWLTSTLIERVNVSREKGAGNVAMLRGIGLTIEEMNRLKNNY